PDSNLYKNTDKKTTESRISDTSDHCLFLAGPPAHSGNPQRRIM
ncbi:MAG: hypothetical protein BJ554DRAFT_3960, partial [Olpidium bornovanus]